MQDVPAYLERKGLTFAGYLNPDRPAVLDSAHTVRVNYETFAFASTAACETFRGDIVRYCGFLTDPVTKRRFRPHVGSPRHLHGKVTYLFESDGSRTAFVTDPERHRLPGFEM